MQFRTNAQRAALIVAAVVIALGVLMWNGFYLRIGVWDDVHRSGKMRVECNSVFRDVVSERTAFGLCLCSVTVVSVDRCSDGAHLMQVLGEVGSLTEFTVANSSLTDESLKGLARSAREITILNLPGNQISDVGVIPLLRHGDSIRFLNLDSTAVSDAVGPEIMSLPRLEHLSIRGTTIGGSAFNTGKWVGAPYHMDMSNSGIEKSPMTAFPNNTIELKLDGNGSIGGTLESVGKLHNLQLLSIGGNDCTTDNGVWARNLKRLGVVVLSGSAVSDKLLHEICSLGSVFYLDISGAQISDGGWDAVCNCESLLSIVCRGTDMRRVALSQLAWKSRVRRVDLTNALISEEQVEALRLACGDGVVVR